MILNLIISLFSFINGKFNYLLNTLNVFDISIFWSFHEISHLNECAVAVTSAISARFIRIRNFATKVIHVETQRWLRDEPQFAIISNYPQQDHRVPVREIGEEEEQVTCTPENFLTANLPSLGVVKVHRSQLLFILLLTSLSLLSNSTYPTRIFVLVIALHAVILRSGNKVALSLRTFTVPWPRTERTKLLVLFPRQ